MRVILNLLIDENRLSLGKEFEIQVANELAGLIDAPETIISVRDHFLKINPEYDRETLNRLEKRWGDITFTHCGNRYWVECHRALADDYTRFCDLKRQYFVGDDKFYALSHPGGVSYIRSNVWNSYVSKCDRIKHEGRPYRSVRIKNIMGIKMSVDSCEKFVKRYLT